MLNCKSNTVAFLKIAGFAAETTMIKYAKDTKSPFLRWARWLCGLFAYILHKTKQNI
jgi:hypothetical protein